MAGWLVAEERRLGPVKTLKVCAVAIVIAALLAWVLPWLYGAIVGLFVMM